MVWLLVVCSVVFYVGLALFRRAINQQFDRKGPTKGDPELEELYRIVGKAKAHHLMNKMKRDYPSKPKQWAIQQLISGIRAGRIKP